MELDGEPRDPQFGAGAAEIAIETASVAGGVPVVTLSGELDSSNAASLHAAMTSILAERPDRVVFDLGDLRFMDSAGIAVLIGVSKVSEVQLRNPSPIVRRVVEVTGLSQVLPVES
jgi:anti-sigma B factor antagonist